ncbi:DNA-methyltransferase [Endozoicomonas sp. 2B-B]
MGYSNQFFNALGVSSHLQTEIKALAKRAHIPVSRLKYYNDHNILPSGSDLDNILHTTGIDKLELMLKMGRLDRETIAALQEHASGICSLIKDNHDSNRQLKTLPYEKTLETNLGTLYQGDCLSVLADYESDCADLVFADPPFNLNKLYPSGMDDNVKTETYLDWCQKWIEECIRILKPGGALLIWNLPRWNTALGDFLDGRMTFRHWIAVDIKYTLPIQKRLYPSHYSLVYYIKGDKPNAFHADRLPMQTCPKCHGDLKDYGGYKDKMNPLGINISDVWLDIPPVRHTKYKRRAGANELSLKLLDRIIEMTTDEGDLVVDPFAGSGTTLMAAELKKRRWMGIELGPSDDVINRFNHIKREREILEGYRENLNALFPEPIKRQREAKGLWTCESVRKAKDKQASLEL